MLIDSPKHFQSALSQLLEIVTCFCYWLLTFYAGTEFGLIVLLRNYLEIAQCGLTESTWSHVFWMHLRGNKRNRRQFPIACFGQNKAFFVNLMQQLVRQCMDSYQKFNRKLEYFWQISFVGLITISLLYY